MKHRTALLLVLLLTATPAVAAPRHPEPVADVDVLELDLEMARFLVRHVHTSRDPQDRLRELMEAIFDRRKGLGITYEDTGTKTAVETFRSKSGNCLSFTILFVAMARHIGLDAYFQEVSEVMSWDRRGDVVLRNQHMFVEVEVENAHVQVDFLPGGEKRYRSVRRISEERALAHYYNNLGADILAAGDAELALAYFEKSLAADETFGHAWTNQGVAHRRLGHFEQAEASHQRALAIDRGNPTAATNLASLYLSAGLAEQAEPLLAQADDYLRRNPFHRFQLGMRSLHEGDLPTAIGHFREAIRRSPEEPEFHTALSDAYARSGDPEKARQSLERALNLSEDEDDRKRLQRQLADVGGTGGSSR